MHASTEPATSGIGQRLRTTFGPTLAGLIGGALAGLLSLAFTGALCRNMAATYDKYPSLTRPWMAQESIWPDWLIILAALVGIAGPVCVGALTAWLARPRDLWADLSAGLTAALAATVAAFATCTGGAVILALVVVPSIADLTTFSESPAKGNEVLTRRYPDLESVAADERGGMLMAKIVSDQVAGSVAAAGYGIGAALLTAGVLALAGTLAAGHLARRGDRPGRLILPYLEMTLPAAATVALAGSVAFSEIGATLMAAISASGLLVLPLAAVAALMVVGAARRWPWLLRACLAFTWIALYAQARPGGATWLPLVAVLLTLGLLARQLAGSLNRPVAVSGDRAA